jgi:putative transposase
MPSRNVLKIDIADSYYHVYARGSSRKAIYQEEDDFSYFLGLFHRYLSDDEVKDGNGVPYSKLSDDIELLAYCLMNNHFHLLIYQNHEGGMQRLMRGVMTSYSHYFNKKYDQSGPLFESRYKASRISTDEYLMHVSRYIHLNPDDWQTYRFSSIGAYRSNDSSDWLNTDRILQLFSNKTKYMEFVNDYKDVRDVYEYIKHELAN